jgi:tRNA-specific 2-thiouridylase
MNLRGKRIFVGLSGGVDSSVTAALLKEAGADVTGVFIKGWYPPGMPCTWADDRRDAMRVAARLQIPFYTLEAGEEYKRGVIDYLLAEYAAGRTPNPDIMCNREVKFGVFERFAQSQKADFIATGHYARVDHDGKNSQLLRGIDEGKDQSYFLWAIPKDALSHALFPLGNKRKAEVRALAQKFKLPVAEKKDSQGICFLGNISVEEFLQKELEPEPGIAIDEEGKEVGKHSGAILHTLGERIALETGMPGPWYVLKKDMQKNTLIVSHSPAREEKNPEIRLREQNWFQQPEGELEAQYRYHGPRIKGKLSKDLNSYIPSDTLNESLAAGQSLVIYRGDECIGGGIIS